MKKEIRVSIIITTYNWPEALNKVMAAIAQQTYQNFEVIIADDGSGQQTLACIQQMKAQYGFNIQHVWQPDEGFQAAKIRNKAVALAEGEYLIFLDGDCIPLPHFVARHIHFSELGWFVAGNRILLGERFTKEFLHNETSISQLGILQWLALKKNKDCNRILPLVYLPVFPRKLRTYQWQGAKTCNLGMWKADFVNVNGFDESFIGWGHEDSDLICRLLKMGIKRKEGRYALPVIHCWHPEQDRSLQKENFIRFQDRLTDTTIVSSLGINQYLTQIR